MDTFMTIQAVFYILSSLVIVVVGVLLVITIYYLIGILRNTRNIFDDIDSSFKRTKNIINSVLGSFGKSTKSKKKK